jgi:hypothetical protein
MGKLFGSGDLRKEFEAELRTAMAGLERDGLERADALLLKPRAERVKEPFKKDAAAARDRLTELAGAKGKNAGLPYEPRAEVADRTSKLEAAIADLGAFELRVNVLPFAEAVLKRDGKESAKDTTPLRWADVEIAKEGYVLELVHEGRRVEVPLRRLEHGVTVTVGGDMRTGKIVVTPPDK